MDLKSTSIALFSLLVIGGCSSSSSSESNTTDKPTGSPNAPAKEEQKSPRELALEKNLEGQAIVIVPFDTTKPDCANDPETMPRETFAACTYIDPAQLPSDFAVTKDPMAFRPATSTPRSLVLAVLSSNVLENETTNRWYALFSMGPAPTSSDTGTGGKGGSLIGSSIHPNILPAIPLVLGGGALVEGATALFAAATIFFGARAIVQTRELLEQREATVVTSSVADTMKKEEAAQKECKLELVQNPSADSFDCFEAGYSYGAAACESAIPHYARVRCSSNCTGPAGEFKILCGQYKVCEWEPNLKECKRALFSDQISSTIANGCEANIAKQKPSNFCTPKQ